jgi:hypothetical protein
MIEPRDLRTPRPITLHEGTSTTRHVWEALNAADTGDLTRLQELVALTPALATCQYDYTSPLHLAVVRGHVAVCRYLVTLGAFDPEYRNHPFLESLLTLARDRGAREIEELLSEASADPSRSTKRGDTGAIDFGFDDEERGFQKAVDRGDLAAVEAALVKRPELARDERAFWGEGILAMPAKEDDRPLIDLLMKHGAKVPDTTKWGARYYFERTSALGYLLERGANPNHRSWRGFSLLHDFAFTGEVAKLTLLLDHGAAIDAFDDEYASTPLGYAAHWGQDEAAAVLLACGADPTAAGAPWATPLAWARRKGHKAVEDRLLKAGARA